jgi:hypothetical protein
MSSWIKANAVRIRKTRRGTVVDIFRGSGRPNPRTPRRNVAAGFYDEDAVFHPIRASFDYSPARAGERARPRRAKARRRRARRR